MADQPVGRAQRVVDAQLRHTAATAAQMPDTTVSAQPVVDAQLDLAGRCFADELPKLLEGRLYDLQLLDVADNSLGDAGVSALVAALCQPGCGAYPGSGILSQ